MVSEGRGQRRNLRIMASCPFEAKTGCMTNLVTLGEGSRYLLTKGAPEVIKKMLKDVPPGFQRAADQWAGRGKRVLALAWRQTDLSPMDLRKNERSSVECDMLFAGFAIFSCPEKVDSRD